MVVVVVVVKVEEAHSVLSAHMYMVRMLGRITPGLTDYVTGELALLATVDNHCLFCWGERKGPGMLICGPAISSEVSYIDSPL